MRQPTRLSLALASLMAISTNAQAGLTATLTGASDYLFDGVSQTDGGPALQGSLDYAHDSGLYLGTWASNVDYADSDDEEFEGTEQDYYGGFYFTASDGFDIDIGAAKYTYHGFPSTSDYTEYYAGVVFNGSTKLKYYYADDDVFAGSAWRIKANHDVALNDDWTLKLEATYTSFADLADDNDYSDDDQLHAKVGFSTNLSGFILEFGVQSTDKSKLYKDFYGEDNVDETLYLTISRTFELL